MRVLIIESPSLEDVTSGDRTGHHLAELLKLLRIPYAYQPIHTKGLLDGIWREVKPMSMTSSMSLLMVAMAVLGLPTTRT